MHYAFRTTKSLVFATGMCCLTASNVSKGARRPIPFHLFVFFSFPTDFAYGGELFAHLNRQVDSLHIDQVRLWSAQVVLALETLHRMNIIYRDLKLENILIDSDGNIVLTDFGMSQMLPPPYRANDYGGTLPYIGKFHYCISFEGVHCSSEDFGTRFSRKVLNLLNNFIRFISILGFN